MRTIKYFNSLVVYACFFELVEACQTEKGQQILEIEIMGCTEKVKEKFETEQDNQVNKVFEEKRRSVIEIFFSRNAKYFRYRLSQLEFVKVIAIQNQGPSVGFRIYNPEDVVSAEEKYQYECKLQELRNICNDLSEIVHGTCNYLLIAVRSVSLQTGWSLSPILIMLKWKECINSLVKKRYL